VTEDEFEQQLRVWIERRIATSGVTHDDFEGLGDERIDELESDLGVRFPGCVRRFLAISGARLGKLQAGSDYEFGAWALINEAGRETFEEEGVPLPDDGLIIFSHQGYDYLFLRTGSGVADPPVYRYVEGEKAATQRFQGFSEYVEWLFSGALL
jgi:hypothetical protein